jgi:hypothetical protein
MKIEVSTFPNVFSKEHSDHPLKNGGDDELIMQKAFDVWPRINVASVRHRTWIARNCRGHAISLTYQGL